MIVILKDHFLAMSDLKDRQLVNEVVKAFIANQWVITPEGIWGYLQGHQEAMEFEKVLVIYQEITQEGIKN